MGIESDNHEKLVLAYLDYFKTYDKYIVSRSVRTYYAHQKNVRKIMQLAKLINKELQEEFYAEGTLAAGARERRMKRGREKSAQQKQNKRKDL